MVAKGMVDNSKIAAAAMAGMVTAADTELEDEMETGRRAQCVEDTVTKQKHVGTTNPTERPTLST